jgi:hypothetical protein
MSSPRSIHTRRHTLHQPGTCNHSRGRRQSPIHESQSAAQRRDSKTVSGLWVRRGFKSLPLRLVEPKPRDVQGL